jgi:predicted dehydrogenase
LLRIAVIGCGKIADDHLDQIQKIQNGRECKVVAACDREPLMAKQLAERFRIERHFGDAEEMLKECNPEVVHITTPPRSHHCLGKLCLENGSHVYIEKPFTVNAEEAEELIHLANRKGLKVTVGHDIQFSHVARRLRRLVGGGYLGGRPLHMESYYCYDLSDPRYAKAFLSNDHHWLRDLPGMLLHNIISHGIARVAEYFTTEHPTVFAHGFVSPMLRGFGERQIVDELRVMIMEEERTTAYFTFSSQMRPSLNAFRVFGPKNGLSLDQDRETLLKLRGDTYKSYAEKFIPPAALAWQQISNLVGNLRRFLRNDFHMKAGMKHLIEAFYAAIQEDAPLPIPVREILLTARIMDQIFEQLRPEADIRQNTSAIRPKGLSQRTRLAV